VVRLGDGTDESHARMDAALKELWRFVPELFASDAVDEEASASGLGPAWAELREAWLAEMGAVLDEALLAPPAESAFLSTGKRGVHSEHMGYILAEMQHLQRAYPGGVW
jgi:ring-1,2-phenylacetyl-CoA epoxidase subunit PaaC